MSSSVKTAVFGLSGFYRFPIPISKGVSIHEEDVQIFFGGQSCDGRRGIGSNGADGILPISRPPASGPGAAGAVTRSFAMVGPELNPQSVTGESVLSGAGDAQPSGAGRRHSYRAHGNKPLLSRQPGTHQNRDRRPGLGTLMIQDPVAGFVVTLNPAAKTAQKMPAPPMPKVLDLVRLVAGSAPMLSSGTAHRETLYSLRAPPLPGLRRRLLLMMLRGGNPRRRISARRPSAAQPRPGAEPR